MSGKKAALIIEDEPSIAKLFGIAMREAGFEANIAQDGQQGLDLLVDLTPAIIVLDMQLPGITGPEILRHIRDQERLAETHVVVTTANPRMADAVYDLADLVLVKPVSFLQLRDLAKRFA